MALKQRDVNKKYVSIKDGKFYIGKDRETAYDELEGTITNMYFKNEEYQGTQNRKLIIILSDDVDNFQIGINSESNSYSALVSFLRNVDLKQAVTLHPMEEVIQKDGAEVKKRTILVSQDGKFAKSYFTKDNNHGLPKWEQVVVGKKKVTDKSAYVEFLENFVTTELLPQITDTPVTKTTIVTDDEDTEVVTTTAEEPFPWDK